MLICDWGDSTDPYVCVNCGAVRSRPVKRKCGLEIKKEKTYCKWESLGDNDVKCSDCGTILPKNAINYEKICPAKSGSQGLGDLIAKGLKKIGIEQKKGCGCGQRQEALNKLVPFKKKDNQ